MSAVKLCLFFGGDQDAFCQCDADLWIQFLIQRMYLEIFFHIFVINGICAVHPLGNLVQIAANVSKQGIHFPDVGVVHIIDKTIKHQFPEKC